MHYKYKSWQLVLVLSILISIVVTRTNTPSDIFINASLCFLWVSFYKLLSQIQSDNNNNNANNDGVHDHLYQTLDLD